MHPSGPIAIVIFGLFGGFDSLRPSQQYFSHVGRVFLG